LLVQVSAKDGEIKDHVMFKSETKTSTHYRYQTSELNDLRIKYAEAEIDKNQKEIDIYEKLREKVRIKILAMRNHGFHLKWDHSLGHFCC
jgi:DNA mismatch repair ATPase MutS